MITPQTNITLEEIAERFQQLESFAICGHVNPDGDCLGSQLALAHALLALGKEVTCLLASDDPVPANLRFLPGIDEMVPAGQFAGTPECFIGIDVPTLERIGEAAQVHARCAHTFTLDHHANETTYCEHVYVDPDSPSASLIAWKVITLMGAQNEASALCALTGCITDTGRYSYQNTTPEAFVLSAEMVQMGASPALVTREFFQNRRLASIKLEQRTIERMRLVEDGSFAFSYLDKGDFAEFDAVKADAEPLIDTLRGIEGVRVALILRQTVEGEVRGSLRAKDDTDVAQVARHFGGGGHKAAAGFTFRGTMDQALVEVPAMVSKLCFG